MAPLFSIITVTYNAASTLPATLASVKEQSCKQYEYIVMDGLSKDNTVEMAKAADIPNARIFSSSDKGLYDAMNKAIDEATGDYLIFLNAGDAFHAPDTLQTIADAIVANGRPDIVYGQTQLVNANRQRIGDRHLIAPEELTFKSFAQGMLVCHQAFIASRKIAQHYDLQYRFSADYEWCLRCLKQSSKNVYVPHTIIDYLSEGLTTANRKASLKERFNIMCHYYGTIPTIVRHLKFIPRFLKQRRIDRKASQI
ncbi:MAG: glycosyltransferase [Muribaculaceae bacterium]|nr:glycosyltransferase [Muribaculaceae bacterium]MBQ7853523.1 glycosyltransferase [Muribaculaceae bacterium]